MSRFNEELAMVTSGPRRSLSKTGDIEYPTSKGELNKINLALRQRNANDFGVFIFLTSHRHYLRP